MARRFGFEVVTREDSLMRNLQAFGDNCIAWLLTRAFNPAALHRQAFLRGQIELWMPRQRLLAQCARPRTRMALPAARAAPAP